VNLNVELTDLEPCRKQLRFTLPAEDVDAAFGRVTSEFRKQANLPGFRKGKAPAAKVKAQFSEQIAERVRNQLLDECYQQGLKEHDLQPVTSPDPEELTLTEGEAMSFLVNIETMPQFDLPEYKGLTAEQERAEVTDKDVENAINGALRNNAKRVDCDRPVEDNDYVVVSFTGTSDGKPLTEFSPTARGMTEQQGMPLHVYKEADHDHFIPGFTTQLIGAQAGETRTIEVTIPDSFPAQEKLQGLNVKYEVTVDKVQAEELPELTDEFAKNFGVDNVDALKERTRTVLAESKTGDALNKMRGQLRENLLKELSFPVPESWKQSEMHNMIEHHVRRLRSQGVSQEQIEEAKDEITRETGAIALQNIRWNIVSQKIAKAENIKVASEEISRAVVMNAQQTGADVQAVIKELQENQQMQLAVRDDLLQSKVIMFLTEHATITEVDPPEPTEDEHSHS